jgi:hypothetical protein
MARGIAGPLTLRGVNDAKIRLIVSDAAAAISYGDRINVPGIQEVSIKPEFENDELKGDGVTLDTYSKILKVTGSVKHAQLSLQLLAAITGGAYADSGASGTEKRKFVWSSADNPAYFELDAQSTYQGGSYAGGVGDCHFIIPKAKITSFEVSMTNDAYATVSFDFDGVVLSYVDPETSKSALFIIEDNELAVALTEGATALALTSLTPAAGATGIAINVTPVAVFTGTPDLAAAYVTSSYFKLIKSSDGSAVTLTSVTESPNGTVTLTPAANLTNSTAYKVIIYPDVKTSTGLPLGRFVIHEFTTVAA